jgi:hypothetical protein
MKLIHISNAVTYVQEYWPNLQLIFRAKYFIQILATLQHKSFSNFGTLIRMLFTKNLVLFLARCFTSVSFVRVFLNFIT